MTTFLLIFGAKYLYLLIVAVAGFYFLRLPRIKQKQMILYGVVAFPIMFLLLKLAAFLYYDPRPFVLGNFTPLIPHEADNGFPSDHTLLCSAIASLLFPFNKKLSINLWLLTFLVAISRVYTGVHHPVDVLASIVIAILVATPVYLILKYYKKLDIKQSEK